MGAQFTAPGVVSRTKNVNRADLGLSMEEGWHEIQFFRQVSQLLSDCFEVLQLRLVIAGLILMQAPHLQKKSEYVRGRWKYVYFTRGASFCRFGSQAPVVRFVPWFDIFHVLGLRVHVYPFQRFATEMS